MVVRKHIGVSDLERHSKTVLQLPDIVLTIVLAGECYIYCKRQTIGDHYQVSECGDDRLPSSYTTAVQLQTWLRASM